VKAHDRGDSIFGAVSFYSFLLSEIPSATTALNPFLLPLFFLLSPPPKRSTQPSRNKSILPFPTPLTFSNTFRQSVRPLFPPFYFLRTAGVENVKRPFPFSNILQTQIPSRFPPFLFLSFFLFFFFSPRVSELSMNDETKIDASYIHSSILFPFGPIRF